MYDSIIILGATATGKTGLSIELAKELNTEIINADSMYIYKDLNIGTAKPTLEEMQGITHHIIDVAEPNQEFNVVDFRNIAKEVISRFRSINKIPIIVGGTGFYIDSLIKNYSYGNATKSDKIRHELELELKQYGNDYLHNKLRDLSPETALKIHPNDTVRVIRAIEIILTTGSHNSLHLNYEEPILKNPLIIGLNIPRDKLYEKINLRVDIMVNKGLIQEVENLYKLGYNPNLHQSMRGIGYKEIYQYLIGETTLENALNKIKQHTRNYAKRQITWFKRNSSIIWFDLSTQSDIITKVINLFNNY